MRDAALHLQQVGVLLAARATSRVLVAWDQEIEGEASAQVFTTEEEARRAEEALDSKEAEETSSLSR
jgi:hypothetical protein